MSRLLFVYIYIPIYLYFHGLYLNWPLPINISETSFLQLAFFERSSINLLLSIKVQSLSLEDIFYLIVIKAWLKIKKA